MKDPRYPIGKFTEQPFSKILLEEKLLDIKFLPQLLENAITGLDEAQLHTPYREGGWTPHTVVHHVADSHTNMYTRVKLAVSSETTPTIAPYDENIWAVMQDAENLPVNISLTLLHALHARLYEFLRTLPEDYFTTKQYYHPERKEFDTVWKCLQHYAWHGKHHTAHITYLREKMNW
ncbi:YfiT family bacillithiol transferase [Gynurincola endophyticus]|jgi:uncharacterized damage-inducible protein DinB|uniref:YfiT family bacillithiol transferase n=1 Tax=Gynurincola endophyticus TaxID=2479004 RepID=UPI000F8E77DC|nr:putative metal-dependent hydrolase [Gynurincola endophyticus]